MNEGTGAARAAPFIRKFHRSRRAEAAARRVGMTWVGETEKYYGLRLNVFRVRPADLAAGPA